MQGTPQPDNGGNARPIVFAVRDLPITVFGGRHGRQTRKFVLLTIATHANPDGSSCYPAAGTVARECGLSVRAVQKVIAWLRDKAFLRIAIKMSPLRTNLFTVIPETVNASVHGERQSSSRTETSATVNGSGVDGERQGSPNLPIPTKKKPTPSAPIGAVAEAFCLEHGIGGRQNKRDIQDLLNQWRKKYSDSEDEIAALWTRAWNCHQEHHVGDPWRSIVRYLQAGEGGVLQDYKAARFWGDRKA